MATLQEIECQIPPNFRFQCQANQCIAYGREQVCGLVKDAACELHIIDYDPVVSKFEIVHTIGHTFC